MEIICVLNTKGTELIMLESSYSIVTRHQRLKWSDARILKSQGELHLHIWKMEWGLNFFKEYFEIQVEPMHAKKMEKCLEQHREIIEKMQQKEMIWAFVPWNNVSILFREGCCLAKGMLNRMKWLRLAPSLQLDLGSRNEILEGPLMFSSNAWRKDLDDYPEQNLVAHWVLSNLHTKSFCLFHVSQIIYQFLKK